MYLWATGKLHRLDLNSACNATRLPLQNPQTTRIADVPEEGAEGEPESATQNLNTTYSDGETVTLATPDAENEGQYLGQYILLKVPPIADP